MIPLRSVLAKNPGPFTHEGTRTYLVGRRRVAVVDPGPDLPEHLDTLSRELADADDVTILLTHGHGDHAGGVDGLLARLPDARVAGAGHARARSLRDGDAVDTDVGTLVAVATPGHTPDHLSFHWRNERALFCGDMALGVGDTTWVAEYPGCVADWLASLARLESLPLETVYPAHGPDVRDPEALWARYRAHREGRIARVREAMDRLRGATRDDLLDEVYGDTVPPGLRAAALASLGALVEYVETHPGSRP